MKFGPRLHLDLRRYLKAKLSQARFAKVASLQEVRSGRTGGRKRRKNKNRNNNKRKNREKKNKQINQAFAQSAP